MRIRSKTNSIKRDFIEQTFQKNTERSQNLGDWMEYIKININYKNRNKYNQDKRKIIELLKNNYDVINNKSHELPDGRVQLKIYVK